MAPILVGVGDPIIPRLERPFPDGDVLRFASRVAGLVPVVAEGVSTARHRRCEIAGHTTHPLGPLAGDDVMARGGNPADDRDRGIHRPQDLRILLDTLLVGGSIHPGFVALAGFVIELVAQLPIFEIVVVLHIGVVQQVGPHVGVVHGNIDLDHDLGAGCLGELGQVVNFIFPVMKAVCEMRIHQTAKLGRIVGGVRLPFRIGSPLGQPLPAHPVCPKAARIANDAYMGRLKNIRQVGHISGKIFAPAVFPIDHGDPQHLVGEMVDRLAGVHR